MNANRAPNDPPRIIGVGELLWDLLPTGPAMGGAAANFACHANALGARARIISRVGNDSLGRDLIRRFEKIGLPSDLVQTDETAPTGTVAVSLSGEGVPEFTIEEDVAWDCIAAPPEALEAVQGADAVCFGTLAQRSPVSRQSIQRLLAAATSRSWRVLDINLRQKFYSRELIEQSLRLANVLKLNDGELATLTEAMGLGENPRSQIERLAGKFGLRLVALTRGAHGSLLYQDGRWSEQRPQPIQVVDTVGAGDAFTAALTMGLLVGMDLDDVHAAAAAVARYVCTRAGAMPPLPPELSGQFLDSARPGHRARSLL
jgi:fructokinase